jgi:hypothetical protein
MILKKYAVKLSLYLLITFLVLILLVTVGAALLSSSTALASFADRIHGIPVALMFCFRLSIYAALYYCLPGLIRKKRPNATHETIRRAQFSLLRILFIYELLFGLNLISILLEGVS